MSLTHQAWRNRYNNVNLEFPPWLLCLNLALYLGPCDWPLWRWLLCWWLSGGSRSPPPPWVKNGRCSAACGEWRHPTLACSMHTTGKHHREEGMAEERGGEGGGGGEGRGGGAGQESHKVMVVRRGVGWEREREREIERERHTHTPKSDANTVTDTKPLVSS